MPGPPSVLLRCRPLWQERAATPVEVNQHRVQAGEGSPCGRVEGMPRPAGEGCKGGRPYRAQVEGTSAGGRSHQQVSAQRGPGESAAQPGRTGLGRTDPVLVYSHKGAEEDHGGGGGDTGGTGALPYQGSCPRQTRGNDSMGGHHQSVHKLDRHLANTTGTAQLPDKGSLRHSSLSPKPLPVVWE